MMSVITTSPTHRFPWYVRLFFKNQKRRCVAVLESARLWDRTPKVFTALALLYGAFDRRFLPIELALRTLITVRVSQINDCAFCVDLNCAFGLRREFGPDKLAILPLFAESCFLTDREKAALSYWESVIYSDRRPSTAQFEQLRHFFDNNAIYRANRPDCLSKLI